MLAPPQGLQQTRHRLNACAEALRQQQSNTLDWVANLGTIPAIAGSIGLGIVSAVCAEATTVGLAFTTAAAIIAINVAMTKYHDSLSLTALRLTITAAVTAGLAIPFKYMIESASDHTITPELSHIIAAGAVFGCLFYLLQQRAKNHKDDFANLLYIGSNACISNLLLALFIWTNFLSSLSAYSEKFPILNLIYDENSNTGSWPFVTYYFQHPLVEFTVISFLQVMGIILLVTTPPLFITISYLLDLLQTSNSIGPPIQFIFMCLKNLSTLLNFTRFIELKLTLKFDTDLALLSPLLLLLMLATIFLKKPEIFALPPLYKSLKLEQYNDYIFLEFRLPLLYQSPKATHYYKLLLSKCNQQNSNNSRCHNFNTLFKNSKTPALFALLTAISLVSNIGDIYNIGSAGRYIFETQININAIAFITGLLPLSILTTLYPKIRGRNESMHLRMLCKLASRLSSMIYTTSVVAMCCALFLNMSQTNSGPTPTRLAIIGLLMGLSLTQTAFFYHIKHQVAKRIDLDTGELLVPQESTTTLEHPSTSARVAPAPEDPIEPTGVERNELHEEHTITTPEALAVETPATPAASIPITQTPTGINTTATILFDGNNGLPKNDSPTIPNEAHV